VNLAKLREIASNRTPGRFTAHYEGNFLHRISTVKIVNKHGIPTAIEMMTPIEEDAIFITAMANHISALLDVVEAAKVLLSSCCEDSRDLHGMLELEDALAKLESVE